MKNLLFGLVLVATSAAAANVALVYDNDAAVLAGQAALSAATPDGILVSAKWVLANNATMKVVIPGEPLKKGVLLRLDAKSDAALIQAGEAVTDDKLQKAYQDKAQSFSAFLPSSLSTASAS